jgi:hypothetical protein
MRETTYASMRGMWERVLADENLAGILLQAASTSVEPSTISGGEGQGRIGTAAAGRASSSACGLR